LSNSVVVGPDRNGRTVAIVAGRVVAAAPAHTEALPCPAGEIVPGAVNAHTHLYSGLAPLGLPPPVPAPDNFLQILERIWWRLDRALDAESLAAAAEHYVAHALLAGTTTLVDHHESPNLIAGSLDILAQACERLGMRALLCYGATERNDGRDEARAGLAACATLKATALVRPLVGLHASFTVSDATIREAGALARRLGTVLHVHVAEDAADVADAQTRGYAGPLERLEELGALLPGSILAHGVHLTRDQVRQADARHCWLVHNPRSNEGNRVGYAANLGASRWVALGTDGWPADMAAEEAALIRLGAATQDMSVIGRLMAGERLVAERFGAAAPALTPGALGDLMVREKGRVRHVLIDGRLVVRDGMLVHADLPAIELRARAQADRLWQRMATIS
jgi:cytosine/adenosine deaminase-related metal-dependent hydrolase